MGWEHLCERCSIWQAGLSGVRFQSWLPMDWKRLCSRNSRRPSHHLAVRQSTATWRYSSMHTSMAAIGGMNCPSVPLLQQKVTWRACDTHMRTDAGGTRQPVLRQPQTGILNACVMHTSTNVHGMRKPADVRRFNDTLTAFGTRWVKGVLATSKA